jgi:hypothetical protein
LEQAGRCRVFIVIPEVDVACVRGWAEKRTPPEFRAEMRVEVDQTGDALTVFECRPPWDGVGTEWTRVVVARLAFDAAGRRWSLDCADSTGKFHRYDLLGPVSQVTGLLDEIDADPTGIFWG